MSSQVPVRSVKFGGFGDRNPWLRVNDRVYHIGKHLEGRHGFRPSVPLSDRLLRILVALAVARKLDINPEGGWVSAEQLAATVGEVTLREGTRRFLARVLQGYLDSPEDETAIRQIPEVGTHLIQYRPQRNVGLIIAHGRTRGPYRLGVPPKDITFDRDAGVRFLGTSILQQLPSEGWDLSQALAYAQAAAQQCDYLTARAAILKGLLLGTHASNEKQRYGLVADAHHFLGQYAIQLRFPEEAIWSARQARVLFKELKHWDGVVSTLLTEAHAEGQLGNEIAALSGTREARVLLDDNVAPRYRGMKRAECAGVVGQRYSHLQNFDAAEHNLLRALQLAQEVDDRRQVCLWAVRRAENFLRQQNFFSTERTLVEAHDWFERLGVGGMERTVLWRVTAGFSVATGQLDDAVRWTRHVEAFALAHGLDSQVARLAWLTAAIDRPAGADSAE
jgi:tetratricopeptide (TPR) repeat protein